MSQLLEQARQQIADEKAADEQHIRSCQAEIVKIAIRDLSGKSLPDDSRTLIELLEETGMTEQDYTDMLDNIPRVGRYCEVVKEAAEKAPLVPGLRMAIKEMEKRHKEELTEARRQLRRAEMGTQATDAVGSLGFIAAHHPYLFHPFVDTHEGRRNAKPLREVASFKPPAEPQGIFERVVGKLTGKQPEEAAQESPAEPEAVAVPEPTPAPAKRPRNPNRLPSVD